MDATDATALLFPWGLSSTPSGLIAQGDLVILYQSPSNITFTYVKPGETFHNKFGTFPHDVMMTLDYGTKMYSSSKHSSSGFIYLLRPTVELWSLALPHRTQIVSTPDAALICAKLHVIPGAVVIEAGTGSGSLSTAFARSIAPLGHLFTFEFNQIRASTAQDEFKQNGLSHLITVEHRDVCEAGFPHTLDDHADALFLDLPSPWKVVVAAKKALKMHGIFASYSPCIEQVQDTCDALRKEGFEMIKTFETRIIPYDLRHVESTMPSFEPYVQKETKRKIAQTATLEEASSLCLPKVYAKKEREIPGHTAFLTFAVKYT